MKPANILAVDLASGAIAAALLRADGGLFTADDTHTKPHSQTLLPLLKQLMAEAALHWNELELFALGAGPGSFTGIRIAAATLAGLNAPIGKRFLHLSSLAVTARQVESREPVWVIEDARAGDAYVGCYRNGEPLQEDRCLRWDEVAQFPPAAFACHNEPAVELVGWQRLPLALPRSQALADATRAALDRLDDIGSLPRYPQPAYLQASQAERNAHV